MWAGPRGKRMMGNERVNKHQKHFHLPEVRYGHECTNARYWLSLVSLKFVRIKENKKLKLKKKIPTLLENLSLYFRLLTVKKTQIRNFENHIKVLSRTMVWVRLGMKVFRANKYTKQPTNKHTKGKRKY
jgi:hypothetical protein